MNQEHDFDREPRDSDDESLDQLLRDACPEFEPRDVEHRLRDQWKTLATARSRRGKRLRAASVWATAAAVVLAVGWWKLRSDGGNFQIASPGPNALDSNIGPAPNGGKPSAALVDATNPNRQGKKGLVASSTTVPI